MQSRLPRIAGGVAAGLTALVGMTAAPASGSDLLDRNATGVKLAVSRSGVARITYRVRGKQRRVVAWGAIDARQPSASRPQVIFRLNRAGGRIAQFEFANACGRYNGPKLAWLVAACKAPDGSYWALQRWQRMLPNFAARPDAAHSVWELRLSHWRGAVGRLDAWNDWVYGGRYHGLFGRFTYRGTPVYGFRSTPNGVPLDSYGRNLFLDTFNSAYGAGWRRENAFLAHNPNGLFCYGFFPNREPGATGRRRGRAERAATGAGQRYRLTVIGPGVTPDIVWQGNGLPQFDPANASLMAIEQQANSMRQQIAGGDPCGKQ